MRAFQSACVCACLENAPLMPQKGSFSLYSNTHAVSSQSQISSKNERTASGR